MARKCLCDCGKSRQMSDVHRHWWSKTFFVIIRVMVFVNQIMLMAPFVYFKKSAIEQTPGSAHKVQKGAEAEADQTIVAEDKEKGLKVATTPPYPPPPPTADTTNSFASLKWNFKTSRKVTIMSVLLCLVYALASPFLVKKTTDLYDKARRKNDSLYKLIAKFTMTADVCSSLFTMVSFILQREKVVQILNGFQDLLEKLHKFEPDIISFKILLLLIVKIGIFFYELSSSIPFLITASWRLSNDKIIGYLATMYLQEISSFYELTLFTFILLLLAISQQLERQLKLMENTSNDIKMSQLIEVQNCLQKLIQLCVNTFQFAIFIIIIVNFITILCNIYAVLDYYVIIRSVYRTFIFHILTISLELYSLIWLSYLLDRSQRQVKELFLNREEQHFLKFLSPASYVQSDVLWPQLPEFYILGLFPLNNDFALFLLTYSINFIVIILEFQISKAYNKVKKN